MADHVIEIEDGIAVVHINPDHCATIWNELEPETSSIRGVVLSFAQVSYLNSMNIAAIISLRTKCENAKLGMHLADLSNSLASIFRVLKLERLFELGLNQGQAKQKVQV